MDFRDFIKDVEIKQERANGWHDLYDNFGYDLEVAAVYTPININEVVVLRDSSRSEYSISLKTIEVINKLYDKVVKYNKNIKENENELCKNKERNDGVKEKEEVEMNKLNPIEVLELLIKNKVKLMNTFGEVYMSYIKVLNAQAFEPNGYRLTVEKIK